MFHRGGTEPARRGRRSLAPLRGLRWVAATALAVVLTSSVAVIPAGAAATVVVLQMNLCNSGAAKSCYSGGAAVEQAVANIHRYHPQVVTVQEICRDDVYATNGGWGPLAQAMADLYGSRRIRVSFAPARSRVTGGPYRGCINGQEYGVAVIHHGTAGEVHQGWYTNQGTRGGEVRTWTCATVVPRRLTACTTHLTINREVAMRQCRELMAMLATAPWARSQVIVAGDFNLAAEPGAPTDMQACVPPGYDRRTDDAVQHVLFTAGVTWVEGWHEPLPGTDHPLLYQRFRV
jgi:endonuclease/exonuclease/phosphatase family metal-dependent hydrolase